jgi:membrane protein required for colicin V production
MNSFDAVVTAVALLAAAMGFMSGLVRSLAAIFAYLIAAPVAVALTPRVAGLIFGASPLGPDRASIVLGVVFIVVGLLLSALLRSFVDGLAGDDIGLFDRIAGAALGIARIFLVAVLIVVVFDQLIPADREPAFLAGSKLRPYLSAAGQKGLQTLPPDVQAYIDRIKREHDL